MCLLAIPLLARETFGIHTNWNQPSDYLFSSMASGFIATVLALALIEAENARAKGLRWAAVALGMLVLVSASIAVVFLAMISFGIGNS